VEIPWPNIQLCALKPSISLILPINPISLRRFYNPVRNTTR